MESEKRKRIRKNSPSEPSIEELIKIKSQLLSQEDKTPLQEKKLEAVRIQLTRKFNN